MSFDNTEHLRSEVCERAILGMMIRFPGAAKRTKLCDSDFYADRHGVIFSAIMEMVYSGVEVDLITLGITLRRKKKIESIGGDAYLMDLCDEAFSDAGWKDIERTIRDKATIRRALEAMRIIKKKALECDAEASAVVSDLLAAVTEIAGTNADGVVTLQSLTEAVCFADKSPQVQTGFYWLDEILHIRPGNIVVIAGRPSEGKSALATGIAQHVSEDGEVLFCTLEMSPQEQAERIASRLTGIFYSHIARKEFPQPDKDVPSITKALESHEITFCQASTPGALRAEVLSRKAQGRLRMVVIDYMQLMQPDKRSNNRATDVADISRALKLLAGETKIPIIVLSQLNREGDEEPQLRHLRESGAIEQDADAVIAIWTKGSQGQTERTISILKQRAGVRGQSFPVEFDGRFAHFGDRIGTQATQEVNQGGWKRDWSSERPDPRKAHPSARTGHQGIEAAHTRNVGCRGSGEVWEVG